MSILDKFTRNDLNSLCGMNSFFHDMYSDDLHANRNIEQRINEAIYVVKLKIKYIHPPGLCADTIIEQVISEGLDLDQMVIDKMEDHDRINNHINTNNYFYKCLVKLNYITDRIKDQFYINVYENVYT